MVFLLSFETKACTNYNLTFWEWWLRSSNILQKENLCLRQVRVWIPVGSITLFWSITLKPLEVQKYTVPIWKAQVICDVCRLLQLKKNDISMEIIWLFIPRTMQLQNSEKNQITSSAHLQVVSDKAFFSTKKCLESWK